MSVRLRVRARARPVALASAEPQLERLVDPGRAHSEPDGSEGIVVL